jgi:hypothetical protein
MGSAYSGVMGLRTRPPRLLFNHETAHAAVKLLGPALSVHLLRRSVRQLLPGLPPPLQCCATETDTVLGWPRGLIGLGNGRGGSERRWREGEAPPALLHGGWQRRRRPARRRGGVLAAQLRSLPPAGGAPGEAAAPRAPPLPRCPRSSSVPLLSPSIVLLTSLLLVYV